MLTLQTKPIILESVLRILFLVEVRKFIIIITITIMMMMMIIIFIIFIVIVQKHVQYIEVTTIDDSIRFDLLMSYIS